MGAFAYEDITGKLPNYHKSVIRASAQKYPVMAMFDAKGVQVREAVQQWRLEDAPGIVNPATLSGTDKTSGFASNQGPLQKATLEIFTSNPWMVEDLAEITDSIGMNGAQNEAYQQAKNAEQLTRSMNAVFLSNQELQEEDKVANAPFKVRSIYAWLNAALQTVAGYGVNAAYQAAGNYTGTLANFTEQSFKDCVRLSAQQVREKVSLAGFVGGSLKEKMSLFNVKAAVTQATEASVRTVNQNDVKKYVNMVDFFETDHGTVQTVLVFDNLVDLATGLASTKSNNSGFFINSDMWATAWAKPIHHIDLVNQGGGPRGFHKAIGILKCLNPQGQFCVYSDAA
jgi:hypothetical protein